MKTLFLLISLSLLLQAEASFSSAKKQLLSLYSDHQRTFYCDCTYSTENRNNMIDRSECGYVPRNEKTQKGKSNLRARRIEWEHVMPAQNFGRHLPCWKEGGRKACREKSELFRQMEADMVNLVPAIGELNGDRSNYRYDAFEPKTGQYGECRFEVDFKAHRARVRPEIRGDIARIYFYMSSRYAIPLSSQERRMMELWDREDPVDAWEAERMRRISALQE